MRTLAKAGLAALVVAGGAVITGLFVNDRDATAAEASWRKLQSSEAASLKKFDSGMVHELPEIARRYFAASIAPGTPLHTIVQLDMSGTFTMNDRPFEMKADQILAPPRGFVWRARMTSGAMQFAGSDAYEADGMSWTKFWLASMVPLARIGGSEDHARSAAARMVMETIWAPATLLPQNGAVWRQIGSNEAEISFPDVPNVEPVIFRLDEQGRVREAQTMRWTDANPEKIYRLQPFGGRMLDYQTFQGFTIPSEVEIGNMFGTPAYVPFFHARLTSAKFGSNSPA